MKVYYIGNNDIQESDLQLVKSGKVQLQLEEKTRQHILQAREQLMNSMSDTKSPIYGVNTGFGALCNTVIPDEDLDQLQINLIRSHSCGIGPYVDSEVVRLSLFYKIKSLSLAHSGVRLELVEFLITLFNKDLLPCIPEMGSLGASGDLAPLAHLSLVLLGEGKLMYQNVESDTQKILHSLGIKTPGLKAKEGLALINGTQYSLALLSYAYFQAKRIYQNANLVATLSLEAFDGRPEAFDARIHLIRNQIGQIQCAQEIRLLLKDSEIYIREKKHVQDPYSFRCIPQVHGASHDVIDYVWNIIKREAFAVTDNPLVFEDKTVLSGGNFHAQPLALASDFLAIATAELGSISERRLYQLVCGGRGLPDFLTANAGIESGMMIVQYAAASLASQNKQLCTPASVDSIVTSKGQEDHVSMSANAGLKCIKVVNNVEQLLAMEWIAAIQAWSFRSTWNCSLFLKSKIEDFKTYVGEIPHTDVIWHTYFIKANTFLKKLLHC